MVLRKHHHNGPFIRKYSNIQYDACRAYKSESTQHDLRVTFYEGENHDLHFNHTAIAHSLYQIYLCYNEQQPLLIHIDQFRVYRVYNPVLDLLLLH